MKGDPNIAPLTIKELLSPAEQYLIPVYQRNYAWGEGEITQLIQDVIDFIPDNPEDTKNYYLGTLVISERKRNIYETIDGQQRLTTLSLLASVIRHEYPHAFDMTWYSNLNLDFESRESSSETLLAAHSRGAFYTNYTYNESIKLGYNLASKLLVTKLAENNVSIELFAEFLFNHVLILRAPVPEGTDLNHYFEVMNNRGEQLEKHEILKAKLMKEFNRLQEEEANRNKAAFNQIWEACSNMEKYVQYGFTKDQRHILFGRNDWNSLKCRTFEELVQQLYPSSLQSPIGKEYSISDIIKGGSVRISKEEKDDSPDRFNSVINFSNFLLHVLRVQTREDIPLDDKRLIDTFQKELSRSPDPIQFVKDFGFALLKSKFLFDKYVIKREFIAGTDRWSLKRLKWYSGEKGSYVNTFGEEESNYEVNENRKLLMLLSMFHVSTPTLVYKHWLNACLYFLYYKEEVFARDYIQYLESIARSFVFGRFLSSDPESYYDIIYKVIHPVQNRYSWGLLDKTRFTFGNIVNNLVFNYLDYLLWLEHAEGENIIKQYEFTFRSSVEHYYPRNPMAGYDKLEPKSLDSFGNLCLLSHSKNSRLSNLMPIAKKEYYANNTIDSIKQWVMMNEYDPSKWGPESIQDHDAKMMTFLRSQL